ncbi:MAG: hypothetical protein GY697_21600 [Desulfobacterales bacterium]|nr:hypothetical protein [Desulfobacterales bacterium]
MKNTVKKTAIILVAILVSVGISGNTLLAEDQAPVGLIPAADLVFITGEPQGITPSVPAAAPAFSPTLISAADLAFIRSPFSAVSVNQTKTGGEEAVGIITAGDYKFLTGQPDANFLSAFDYFAEALAGNSER